MAFQVNREVFLRKLSEVAPGLSPKEIVEQSSCFVFKDGMVFTFNEEVSCRTVSELPKDFKGAVQAAPLLKILDKLPEEVIELHAHNGHLVVNGKRKESGVRMEKDVLLPIEVVEVPKKWLPLNPDFTEAVTIVQDCTSKDESRFKWTCIHITPDFMEACDNFQMARYTLKTGVKKPILVKKDSLKFVPGFDLNKMAETENWIHFQGPGGLMLSCRRCEDEYQDLSPMLKVKGEKATLPKALEEAAERANVFSEENSDNNQVTVEIKPGKMRVRGQGNSGYHLEIKKLKYSGPPMRFMIAPKLLIQLVQKHSDCEISKNRKLKVQGGRFVYATVLQRVEEHNTTKDKN